VVDYFRIGWNNVVARKGKAFAKRFPTRDSGAVAALAANVRRLRKLKEWSQDRLASETSLEQNAISLIENRKSNPTLIAIDALAKALGTTVSELLQSPVRTSKSKRGPGGAE
jgi:DNA-binding XRE family transcriptional regulator